MSATEHDSDIGEVLVVLDAMLERGPRGLKLETRGSSMGKQRAASGESILFWLLRNGHACDSANGARLFTRLVQCGGLIPLQGATFNLENFTPNLKHYYSHFGMSRGTDHGMNSLLKWGLRREGPQVNLYDLLKEIGIEFRRMLEKVTRFGGREVRYEKIRATEEWKTILYKLALMEDCDVTDIDDECLKKATLFNIFNLMIIHGKLVFGHPHNIFAQKKFFDDASYCIGGCKVSCTHLKHGILRGRYEGRLSAINLQGVDPRMHFILNYGTQNCPPLTVLEPRVAERMIRAATERYIDTFCNVDVAGRTVTISRIFKWFRNDYINASATEDQPGDVLRWIANNAPPRQAKLFEILMSENPRKSIRIEYYKFNWADNGNWNGIPDEKMMFAYDTLLYVHDLLH